MKSPGPDGFSQNSTKRTNTNIPQIIPDNRRRRTLPNSFYEASITLIPKLQKDITKKENYSPISLMNINAKY